MNRSRPSASLRSTTAGMTLLFGMVACSSALADDMTNMPGMDMSAPQQNAQQPSNNASTKPSMDMSGGMKMTGLLGNYPMSRDASGTAWQPDAAEHNGIHFMADDWMLMGHLMLTGVYDTQSGPRGDSMGFLSGMAMLMAERNLSDGDVFGLRAMLSPDPLMGARGYPLLLQTGETANGVTHLVDRQHPHDLFMELAASYSHRMSDDNSLFVYFGYPGEPALGPAAFMHRVSGMDNPGAPLSHHWLDSTHVTFGVATAGFIHDDWKIEVSQFTGREPDQHRYNFDPARFDSTSARITWNPDEHWSLQASAGFLKSPEQLEPLVNEIRYTASATYVTPLGDGASLAATLAYGLKHLTGGTNESAFLAEAEYKPADLWTIFARAESIQSSELAPGPLRTVGEATLGAIRDFRVADNLKLGAGASYTFDFIPSALSPSYGSNPHGTMLFARVIAD
jgi:hypothetical protein